jgi:phosphohistidine phosphatase SixA
MKHLFVVRHGNCDENRRLDNIGHNQAIELSLAVKNIIKGHSFYLFCSTVPRAIEYAQDIATHLGFSSAIEQVESFGWEEEYGLGYSGYKLQREFIRSVEQKAESVIVVTHQPVAETFLRFFPYTEFGREEAIDNTMKVSVGKGVYIGLELQVCKIIP